jgi:hypothetical protein
MAALIDSLRSVELYGQLFDRHSAEAPGPTRFHSARALAGWVDDEQA